MKPGGGRCAICCIARIADGSPGNALTNPDSGPIPPCRRTAEGGCPHISLSAPTQIFAQGSLRLKASKLFDLLEYGRFLHGERRADYRPFSIGAYFQSSAELPQTLPH